MGDTVRALGPNPLRVPKEAIANLGSDEDGSNVASPEDAVLKELGLL